MHSIYIYHLDIYWYICRISCGTTGCTDGGRPSSDPDGGDPHPCPEDDEFFGVPDAESQEEAINRFMEGLEQQERRGFSQIDRLISSLPVPVLKKGSPRCSLGRLLVCPSTALLHMCSASNEWEIAEKQNLQKRA